MRLNLLFLFCLLFMAAKGNAATLTGTVTSSTTCAAVSGAKVYALDSSHSVIDSAVTNSAGFYSINIPSTLYTAAGGVVAVVTDSAGAWTTYKPGLDAYCNVVHGNGPVRLIRGVAMLGGDTGIIQACKIWLIRRDINPVTFDTSLTAIDSNIYATRFDSTTPYTFPTMYNFQIPCASASDRYFVKAALLPSDPNYAYYLPTYSDSALVWNAADLLSTPNHLVNVYMKQGTNPGGPGFIGGSVLLGANKSTAVGDPLSSRTLILTTLSGQAIGHTQSDASGKFQFSGIPIGTYKIFGDAAGKSNPALIVTLTQANSSISNVVFEENNKKFEGHLATTGISTASNLAGVSIYPNPAKDVIKVQGLEAYAGLKTIVLRNLAGQELSRQQIEGNLGQISIAALPSGVYLLEVHTMSGSGTFRVVK
jgi:hypothetical protein